MEEESKVFNDPIHGPIELPMICVRIINTPEFQRLKNIKQLGGAYFVYPGASHNRFEHSIGVCHLAGEMAKQLQEHLNKDATKKQKHITKTDILCVQIAGLCHDLGHGPYSHLFDKHFYPAITAKIQEEEERTKEKGTEDKGTRDGGTEDEGTKDKGTEDKGTKDKWKHETFSKLIMERILNKVLAEEKDEEVKKELEQRLDFIKELIDPPDNCTDPRRFLYEIVANKRNGIDVDKFDYFARDCYHLGFGSTFDHRRLIKFARVVEVDGHDQICYRDKEVSNLYEMYRVRDMLYRRAYCHKTTLIIEHMFADALVKADDILKAVFHNGKSLSKIIKSSEIDEYIKLDDSLFWLILQQWPGQYEDDARLSKAREILRNILSRKQYRCIKKRIVKNTPELEKRLKNKEVEIGTRAQERKWNKNKEEYVLKGANLLVKVATFDYFKGRNPVDSVRFFSKDKPDEAKQIKMEEVSQMLSPTFKEIVFYFYDKDVDKAQTPDEKDKKEKAIKEFCGKLEGELNVKFF